MKYDSKDIKKALDMVKNLGQVDVTIDPKERLVIAFTDPMGEIPTEITIYPIRDEAASKFAEIKTIKRL